jgi:ribonuclease T1
MRRRSSKPLAIVGAMIAIAVATWLNRGKPAAPPVAPAAPPAVTRSAAPAAPRAERETGIPAGERAQLDATLRLISAGGPFPYRQDGTVFGNREGLLPSQPRGYYHEYTVPTPGASNRGARRVIRGNNGELYYTNDHYRTFIRLDE